MTVAADRRSSGWFWLVQVAASVEAALLFVAGAYLRDAEALAFAFIVLLTLGWILFRPGRVIPVVVRSLVFADVAIWMVPATVSNALNGGSLGSIALPAALGTTAVVGLIAAVGFLLTRGKPAAGRSDAVVDVRQPGTQRGRGRIESDAIVRNGEDQCASLFMQLHLGFRPGARIFCRVLQSLNARKIDGCLQTRSVTTDTIGLN